MNALLSRNQARIVALAIVKATSKAERRLTDANAVEYARRELFRRSQLFEGQIDADCLFGCQQLAKAGRAREIKQGGVSGFYLNDASGTGYNRDRAGNLIGNGRRFDELGFAITPIDDFYDGEAA